MKLESLKSQLNNEKGSEIRGKIRKSYTTFSENKPNLSEDKFGASPFETGKYEILSACRVKKQTQSKPNPNPIAKRPKMNVRNVITMNYKDFVPMVSKKQTQFKPDSNPISPIVHRQSSIFHRLRKTGRN